VVGGALQSVRNPLLKQKTSTHASGLIHKHIVKHIAREKLGPLHAKHDVFFLRALGNVRRKTTQFFVNNSNLENEIIT
jgi:hypothetical protein